jgi:hypothetical protein
MRAGECLLVGASRWVRILGKGWEAGVAEWVRVGGCWWVWRSCGWVGGRRLESADMWVSAGGCCV